jgi:hypothetical protein
MVDNIIRVVPVPDEVLAPEKHLDRGMFQLRFERSKPFPGIIVQVTDARIEGSSTPRLDREKTAFIDHLGKRDHIFGPEPGGNQGLVGIPQCRIGNLDFAGMGSAHRGTFRAFVRSDQASQNFTMEV